MSTAAGAPSDYAVVEREPPELAARNLMVGAHLWSSATAFFFIAFLFAYFYLRSLNQHHLWRPKHVDPSLTLGTLVTVAVIGAAALLYLGLADHRADRRPQWRVKGAAALALLLAAVVLQVVEWATQGFGPTDGGYASVYVGWSGMFALFLLGLAYWVETTLAMSIRFRKIETGAPEPGQASGDRYRTAHDIEDPLSLVRSGLEATSFYAGFMALIGVVSWVVLYLI